MVGTAARTQPKVSCGWGALGWFDVVVSRGELMRLRWNKFYDVPSSRKPMRPPVMQLESFRQARGLLSCHWTIKSDREPERRRGARPGGGGRYCGAATVNRQLPGSDGPTKRQPSQPCRRWPLTVDRCVTTWQPINDRVQHCVFWAAFFLSARMMDRWLRGRVDDYSVLRRSYSERVFNLSSSFLPACSIQPIANEATLDLWLSALVLQHPRVLAVPGAR
jgi:hypothetical protein